MMCGVCLSDCFSSSSSSTVATSCFTCRERDVCMRKKLDFTQQRSVSLSTSFMIKVTAPSVCLSVCLSAHPSEYIIHVEEKNELCIFSTSEGSDFRGHMRGLATLPQGDPGTSSGERQGGKHPRGLLAVHCICVCSGGAVLWILE